MKLNQKSRFAALPRKLQDCESEAEVADCLELVDGVDRTVPNDQLCTNTEQILVETFACFKKCVTFDCEFDAEDVFLTSGTGSLLQQRCGGVDAQATCETDTFTSNGEPSLIPQECLVDADIETCMIAAGAVDLEAEDPICDGIVNITVDEYACLNECETFSCSALGSIFFAGQQFAAEIGECGNVDFEASCEAGEVVIDDDDGGSPIDCSEDPAVLACLGLDYYEDYAKGQQPNCEQALDFAVAQLVCFKECESFTCDGALAESLFDELSAEFEACGQIDFEEACVTEKLPGAAEGLRVGAMVLLAVGAMSLKMLK